MHHNHLISAQGEVLELLLSAGADVNQLDGEGRTGLHIAVRSTLRLVTHSFTTFYDSLIDILLFVYCSFIPVIVA